MVYATRLQANSLLLSFGVALLTVIPTLFPVLALPGVMNWLDIALDTATASIAPSMLSFCVDTTIHFVYSYQQ